MFGKPSKEPQRLAVEQEPILSLHTAAAAWPSRNVTVVAALCTRELVRAPGREHAELGGDRRARPTRSAQDETHRNSSERGCEGAKESGS